MKLYMHPVSMTSRPVRLFIHEKGIPVDEEVVDLFTGAHHQEPFASINPNRLVPVLEDGDFRLTESSAILKYLAEKNDLPEYPKDLKRRARVNEIMDWFNANFYRDYAYGFIYPQVFPHHKRPTEEAHAETIKWGKANAENWLGILNDYWIGPDRKFLTGDEITIADYFGIGLITLGEVVHSDFSKYPNVKRWMDNVKAAIGKWGEVNEVFYGLVESTRDQPLEAIR
ncbi:glutathione S-transferase family protein [Microbaculum sp. FT89]|uniref:glutathione S-transferase family protein n=1 Tax=Microbaculum sp. FT89 TaxID=3447298 RepID=UPI003F534AB6